MSDTATTEPEIDLDAVKAKAQAFAESRPLIGEEAWLREMEAYLAEEDEDTRYAIADEIMLYEQPPFDAVVNWTENALPVVRDMACYLLRCTDYRKNAPGCGSLYYPQGGPVLLHKLNDSEAVVRASAAYALGHITDASSLPALVRTAADASEEVRYAAAFALGFYGETFWEDSGKQNKSDVQSALLRLMDDEDEDVRDWATFGVHQGSHDTPESRARLWKALEDPFSNVRGEATAALSIFNDRSFIPKLAQLLREDEDCPTLFFEAAETFNDPALLPAVLEAAEGWRETLDEGETLPSSITSAIETLQETAASASAPEGKSA